MQASGKTFLQRSFRCFRGIPKYSFFTFKARFLIFLSLTAFQSQEIDFPFGWKNIFFLRLSAGEGLHREAKCTWKRRKGKLFRLDFLLFEAFPFAKGWCQNAMSIRFVLSRPALSCAEPRSPTFRMLPESSLWTTDCLPSAPRESRISADFRTGTQITDSHEGRFDFLTKTLAPYMKAHLPKPSVREASGLPYFHVSWHFVRLLLMANILIQDKCGSATPHWNTEK